VRENGASLTTVSGFGCAFDATLCQSEVDQCMLYMHKVDDGLYVMKRSRADANMRLADSFVIKFTTR
jgi:hypothetical protein